MSEEERQAKKKELKKEKRDEEFKKRRQKVNTDTEGNTLTNSPGQTFKRGEQITGTEAPDTDMRTGERIYGDEEDQFGNPVSSLRFGAGLLVEIFGNVGLDALQAASTLTGPAGLTATTAIQSGGSAFFNYLNQKIRGEKEINKGEMAAASAASLIPGLQPFRAATKAGRFYKGILRGGTTGVIDVTGTKLGRGEEVTPTDIVAGFGMGGTIGSIYGIKDGGEALKALKNKINKGTAFVSDQLNLDGTISRIVPEEPLEPASMFAAKTEQPSFDDELNRRYKEINNPDSYITDRADPDFGKLKSEVTPVRAAQAAADKKIYDAEKLELDKKFIMEHPLGLDNLVPDDTILDLKKESRQVAALMWDINYPFEDKKGFRYFDQQIREAMERQFPGQDLKLRSHHLNPLKSGAAMLNGLSMEDRAEATARLLDEFGLVGGNSPFQNTVLPREIHNEVHRFLSRFSTRYLSEIGDPQLDNSFYRLSLEGRMPMLKRYAQMIRKSEELIFSLMQAQNIASGAVDTVVTPETATEILSRIPTNTTETTFRFLRDAYDGIKKDLLKELGDDTMGIGGGTNINIAPEGADLKTIRKFEKMQANPQKYVASDDEYRSMALDRIFKFKRLRQLDIFETRESLRAEIARIAKRLKQEDLSPNRGRFRK